MADGTMRVHGHTASSQVRHVEMSVIDPCVHCGESTVFGSGRFVNRIPADDGYACAECMALDCDRCDRPIPLDEDITADDCGMDEFEDGSWRVHEECLTSDETKALRREQG